VSCGQRKFVPYRTPGQSGSFDQRELAKIRRSVTRGSGRSLRDELTWTENSLDHKAALIYRQMARRRTRHSITPKMNRTLHDHLMLVSHDETAIFHNFRLFASKYVLTMKEAAKAISNHVNYAFAPVQQSPLGKLLKQMFGNPNPTPSSPVQYHTHTWTPPK